MTTTRRIQTLNLLDASAEDLALFCRTEGLTMPNLCSGIARLRGELREKHPTLLAELDAIGKSCPMDLLYVYQAAALWPVLWDDLVNCPWRD